MAIPLYLVTGFLGAGKTTLIAEYLRQRQASGNHANGKVGLLVNELGAVGIDGDLLAGGVATQVELPGGCVCCALGDDLAQSIVTMLDARPDLQAVILETTGVAEPLPIAWALEAPALAARVRLACVITVVDAENFIASRSVSDSVDAQVAYADILLLSKGELVAAATKQQVRDQALALAAKALWYDISTEQAASLLAQLLADPELQHHHHETVDRTMGTTSEPTACHEPNCADHSHAGPAMHSHEGRAVPVHNISSLWLPMTASVIDPDDLEDAIAELPLNIVRIKGIARLTTGWVAFHRVGPRFSISPLPTTDASHVPRMVLLGLALDLAALQHALKRFLPAEIATSPQPKALDA